MGYSGAGGKLIHKKTRSKKSRDTVLLKGHCHEKDIFFKVVLSVYVLMVFKVFQELPQPYSIINLFTS